MKVCLGCGVETPNNICDACVEKRRLHVTLYAHWPMETSLSLAALRHVERALRNYLITWKADIPQQEATELGNTANHIRSYFQHVDDGTRKTAIDIDPLLL